MTLPLTDPGEPRLLLAAARAGDERAFRLLVVPMRRALELHCYRLLGAPDEARAIVGETLLRAWRAFDHLEAAMTLETWLYRIATNACLDELERRPCGATAIEPCPGEWLEDPGVGVRDPTAVRHPGKAGLDPRLLTAAHRVPGRQRAVLLLRDVLGWTPSEVAELLGSIPEAVDDLLAHARATVAEHLG